MPHLCAQFGFGLRMNAQASLPSSDIERVAEELLSVDTADMRFLAVYFEEEFPLYELRYTFAHSFGRPRTFAEDDVVVGITHKRKSAPFKFTVEFRQHYVARGCRCPAGLFRGGWKIFFNLFAENVWRFVENAYVCNVGRALKPAREVGKSKEEGCFTSFFFCYIVSRR